MGGSPRNAATYGSRPGRRPSQSPLVLLGPKPASGTSNPRTESSSRMGEAEAPMVGARNTMQPGRRWWAAEMIDRWQTDKSMRGNHDDEGQEYH
jgi:hypothetical protein